MKLQEILLEFSPSFLRWYRLKLTLDFPTILSFIPDNGKLLDIGCGVGSLDYEIGKMKSHLEILGVDIDISSIRLAERHHKIKNVSYVAKPLKEIDGKFDCIIIIDVLHHISLDDKKIVFEECIDRLSPSGYLYY